MDREVTEVVYPVACGLDVHSAIIVACLVRSGPNGRPRYGGSMSASLGEREHALRAIHGGT